MVAFQEAKAIVCFLGAIKGSAALQRFHKYLGLALEIIELEFLLRQLLHALFAKAALQKPVFGAGGQAEKLFKAFLTGLLLAKVKQLVTAATATVSGIYRQAGELYHFFLVKRI